MKKNSSTKADLSKLVTVPIRKAWPSEPRDFTPWLAKPKNLEIIGEIVDIELKLVKCEARVGTLKADILAQNEDNDEAVIIENQLKKTDHAHLGKLITYSSGYNASTLIWIANDIRDEHQAAIRWLNEKSLGGVDFWLIKIELFKIDNSNPAPRFELIEGPAKDIKTVPIPTRQKVKRQMPRYRESWEDRGYKARDFNDPLNTIPIGPEATIRRRTPSDVVENTSNQNNPERYLDFWTNFNQYVADNNKAIRIKPPRQQYYFLVNPGFARSIIRLMVVTTKNEIRCRIRFREGYREFYKYLKQNKNEIEKNLDNKAIWKSHLSSDSILVIKDVGDVFAEHRQEEYFEWLANQAILFQEVFGKYYQKYLER
ncbi:MAG: DUF4268 domain-containing protein [Endozoicomonadaceae bacterium]|nr:DUF4268 domain-containing protein [Endozoicomonadaceae bacterium]